MTDPLSMTLATIAVRAIIAGRAILSAPWGFQIPIAPDGRPQVPDSLGPTLIPRLQPPGGCFYAMLEGTARFEGAGVELALDPGDIVMMTRSASHLLRDAPTTLAQPIWALMPPPRYPDGPRQEPLGPAPLQIDGGGVRSEILHGVLFFDGVTAARWLASLPPVLVIRAATGQRPAWMAGLLAAVEAERVAGQFGHAAITDRFIHAIFDEAVRIHARTDAANICPGIGDPRLGITLSALANDTARDWTVAALAALAGMSRTAFAGHFTKVMGIAPMRYLARLRIERAGAMLRDGNPSIKMVAAAVGFRSEPGFYAAFRNHFGKTPSAFRAEAGGGRP